MNRYRGHLAKKHLLLNMTEKSLSIPIPAGASSLIWRSINREMVLKTFYQSKNIGWENIKRMAKWDHNCLNSMKKYPALAI